METLSFTVQTDYQVFQDYWMFVLLEKKSVQGKKSSFFKYILILGVLVVAVAIFAICNVVLMENALGLIPLILLVGILAALASTVITATKVQPKRQYKLIKEAIESPQKYTFTQKQMEVREEIPEENRESLAEFPYKELMSAYETPKAFYLFISETEAFLIPKNQLEKSKSSALRGILSKKMKQKYFRGKQA